MLIYWRVNSLVAVAKFRMKLWSAFAAEKMRQPHLQQAPPSFSVSWTRFVFVRVLVSLGMPTSLRPSTCRISTQTTTSIRRMDRWMLDQWVDSHGLSKKCWVYSQWNSHLKAGEWSAKPLGFFGYTIFRHTLLMDSPDVVMRTKRSFTRSALAGWCHADLFSIVFKTVSECHLGLSENSVPLNPMVLLIIIPFLNGYFIGNINPTFSGPNPFVNQEMLKEIEPIARCWEIWSGQKDCPCSPILNEFCKCRCRKKYEGKRGEWFKTTSQTSGHFSFSNQSKPFFFWGDNSHNRF